MVDYIVNHGGAEQYGSSECNRSEPDIRLLGDPRIEWFEYLVPFKNLIRKVITVSRRDFNKKRYKLLNEIAN